jgi:hypothetical protein
LAVFGRDFRGICKLRKKRSESIAAFLEYFGWKAHDGRFSRISTKWGGMVFLRIDLLLA